ncbi:hypothetical protein [Streptomyces sp. NPDC029674]|uniref:hypothetical protein n=1 Tax=Streptomyces sp. NPDC029674 TaxID=3365297 RepID=UPI00384A6B1B
MIDHTRRLGDSRNRIAQANFAARRQLGAAQAGVGGVVQFQDPPLPQPGLVAGDHVRDGDGVEEAEAAQQAAG